MNEEQKTTVQSTRYFAQLKKSLDDIATENLQTYYNGTGKKIIHSTERKEPEEIERIIINGNETQLRTLSRQYWDLSGLYKRLISYFANMLTYDVLITPKFKDGKAESKDKEKVIKSLTNACYFVDNLNISKEFARIMTILLTDGVYYGFFKECTNGKFIFQDLDPDYCRTRYKSMNDLPVLEFDLSYFLNLKGREATTNVDELALYPKIVRSMYNKYFNNITIRGKDGKAYIKNKKELMNGRWMLIPDDLGVVFYYKDIKPLFASTIKAIEDLNDYKGIEKSLDKQDLNKILVQQIPMKDGELLFTTDEAVEIHKAVVKMLRNNPNVDVLTTFTDAKMLEVQDSKQANRDNLEKMERSVYNEAGVSKNLFASDGTTALEYSQKVDMALALDIAKRFETFLTYHTNRKFAEKKVFFEVTILPITHYNREEMFDLYLKGAEYGYSKILAGVASGIKQSNLLNLITLENDYLDLATKMVPLQSSHTTSGKETTSDNEGGAPTKDGMDKSDKTRQNEESK